MSIPSIRGNTSQVSSPSDSPSVFNDSLSVQSPSDSLSAQSQNRVNSERNSHDRLPKVTIDWNIVFNGSQTVTNLYKLLSETSYESSIKKYYNYYNFVNRKLEVSNQRKIYNFLNRYDIRSIINEILDFLQNIKKTPTKKIISAKIKNNDFTLIDLYSIYGDENKQKPQEIVSSLKSEIKELKVSLKLLQKEDLEIANDFDIIKELKNEKSLKLDQKIISLINSQNFEYVKDQLQKLMTSGKNIRPTDLQKSLFELMSENSQKSAVIQLSSTGTGKSVGLVSSLPKINGKTLMSDHVTSILPINDKTFYKLLGDISCKTNPVAHVVVLPDSNGKPNFVASYEGIGWAKDHKHFGQRKRNSKRYNIEFSDPIKFLDLSKMDNVHIVSDKVRVFLIHPSFRYNDLIYAIVDKINIFSRHVGSEKDSILVIDDFFATGKESQQVAKIMSTYTGLFIGLTATLPTSVQEMTDLNTSWNLRRKQLDLKPLEVKLHKDVIGGGFTLIDEDSMTFIPNDLRIFDDNCFAKQILSFDMCIKILEKTIGEEELYKKMINMIIDQYLYNLKPQLDVLRECVIENLKSLSMEEKNDILKATRLRYDSESFEETKTKNITKSVKFSNKPMDEIVVELYEFSSSDDYMKNLYDSHKKYKKQSEKKVNSNKDDESDKQHGLEISNSFRFNGLHTYVRQNIDFILKQLESISWLTRTEQVFYVQTLTLVLEKNCNAKKLDFAINDKNKLSKIIADPSVLGAGVHLDSLKEVHLSDLSLNREELWQAAGRVGRPNQDANCYVVAPKKILNQMFDIEYRNTFLEEFGRYCLDSKEVDFIEVIDTTVEEIEEVVHNILSQIEIENFEINENSNTSNLVEYLIEGSKIEEVANYFNSNGIKNFITLGADEWFNSLGKEDRLKFKKSLTKPNSNWISNKMRSEEGRNNQKSKYRKKKKLSQ